LWLLCRNIYNFALHIRQTFLVCLSVGIYELAGCCTVCYGQLGAAPSSGLWRLSERWKAFCWRGDRTHQDWYKLMSKIDVLPASTWLTPRRILIPWSHRLRKANNISLQHFVRSAGCLCVRVASPFCLASNFDFRQYPSYNSMFILLVFFFETS